jgi:hypothetical protein
LEAAYLKKKILTFMPSTSTSLKNYIFFKPNFTNKKDLLKFLIKNKNNNKSYNYKNLTKICKNLRSNNYFYKVFLAKINIFCKDLNSSFEPIYFNNSSKHFLLTFIRKILSKIKSFVIKFNFIQMLLPYEYLITKEEKINKFNKLNLSEIKNILNKFDYTRKKNNISIIKLSESTFLLHN